VRVITLARKPLVGSVAENVLRHGTGGLNIDGSRIGSLALLIKGGGEKYYGPKNSFYPLDRLNEQRSGRFPANVLLEHRPKCRCVGSKTIKPIGGGAAVEGDGLEEAPAWECEPGCPVAALDDQSGDRKTTWVSPSHQNNRQGEFLGQLDHPGHQGYNDEGGASRFFRQVGGRKEKDADPE